jgi:peptidoglycan/xylan/chitin deacetylase (PgdA/CDA1 family)
LAPERLIRPDCFCRCMRHCALTIDVDRDVNKPCVGQTCAISTSANGSEEPRFRSSAVGLERMVDLLDELDIQGTFFFEARTALEIAKDIDIVDLMKGHEIASHAYDHEDLTGKETGIKLSMSDLDDILERSVSTLHEIFGTGRMGFRAPYLGVRDDLAGMLSEKGFKYDSSVILFLKEGEIRPFQLSSGLWEVPVVCSNDADRKKIVGYLWPMHENNRPPEHYVAMFDQFKDGLFVLADHSWHVVESYARGRLPKADADNEVQKLRAVLEGALDGGVEFTRIDDYLLEHTSEGR